MTAAAARETEEPRAARHLHLVAGSDTASPTHLTPLGTVVVQRIRARRRLQRLRARALQASTARPRRQS